MKKLSILLIVFLGISCSDVLEESPKAVVSENYYNTPTEVESAIFDIYRQIKVYNGFGFLYPCQLEGYSDFSQGRGSYSPLKDLQGLNETNIARVGQIWDVFYMGIRGANLVIGNLVDKPGFSEDQLDAYLAEARFMRAFVYFHIVRNWGKAVIRTEQNMLEQNVAIGSREEVADLIEEDLLFAEAHLPGIPAIPGSPSVWAAKTMLADLYFYLGEYDQALSKSEEVIASDNFSLVPVSSVDDFEDLFGAGLVTSNEEIFYLKYSRDIGQGWPYMGFTNYQTTPYFNKSGLGGLILEPEEYSVYNNWDDNDLRKQLWFNWDIGVGSNTLLTKKFIDTDRVDGGGNDYPVYRYADVLLLFAESSCRAGNSITNEAIEAINMVRRRAYGMDPTSPSAVDYQVSDFAGLDEFLDTLMDEQGYEVNMEGGKRWLYLKQNSKVKAYMKGRTGKDLVDKHLLWPIPASELNYNNGIDPVSDQNPGY